MLQNEARVQLYQGVAWYGTEYRPTVAILKGQPGDKPINVQGYDMLLHEGSYVAYGDKRMFRYGIDTVDFNNRLFFYSIYPMGAEGHLIRWLIRKTGDMVTNDGILQMSRNLKQCPSLLFNWCNIEADLFRPENKGYEIFSEPPEHVLRELMNPAGQNAVAQNLKAA